MAHHLCQDAASTHDAPPRSHDRDDAWRPSQSRILAGHGKTMMRRRMPIHFLTNHSRDAFPMLVASRSRIATATAYQLIIALGGKPPLGTSGRICHTRQSASWSLVRSRVLSCPHTTALCGRSRRRAAAGDMKNLTRALMRARQGKNATMPTTSGLVPGSDRRWMTSCAAVAAWAQGLGERGTASTFAGRNHLIYGKS